LLDFYPSFANASFEIGICESKGDPELARQMTLADLFIAINRVKDFQRTAVVGVGYSVHDMNTIPEVFIP
jgi:hypothetical protein